MTPKDCKDLVMGRIYSEDAFMLGLESWITYVVRIVQDNAGKDVEIDLDDLIRRFRKVLHHKAGECVESDTDVS